MRTGIIGKKHVGPESVYPFHCSQTEERTHWFTVHDSVFYSAGVRTPWFTVLDSVFYTVVGRTAWLTVCDSLFYSEGVRTLV